MKPIKPGRAGLLLGIALTLPSLTAPRDAFCQSPALLPPDHWAAEAVRTLDALGALEGTVDRGRRRLTLGEAARLIRGGDGGDDPAAAAILARARRRLDRDFPSTREPASRPFVLRFEGAAGLATVVRGDEVGTRSGKLTPGPDKTIVIVDEAPAPRRPDGARVEPSGFATAAVGPFALAGEARPTATGDVVLGAYGAARAGPVAFWAGRSAPGYGPGRHGSQVLSGDREVLGAGLATAAPFRFPGFLDALGDIRVETFLGKLDRSREVEDPFLWGMRVSTVPHARFGFGVSRVAMFAGDLNGGFDFGHVLRILVVDRRPGIPAENQIGAIDLWFRPPLGGLPLVAWLEWGSDDASGGLSQVPGIVAGLEVPAWPGFPALGVTFEATWMASQCCGNGPWYWHSFFPSGWAVEGRTFGHPLGGEGTEFLVGVDLDGSDSGPRVSVDLFRRDRGPENLYSPVWTGVSNGAELKAELLPSGFGELSLLAYVEDGAGWTRGGGAVGARLRF